MTGAIAITGATGFVGARLLELAAADGHALRALTRRPQPAREGVAWIAGDLGSAAALSRLCEGASVVIHVAGAINAPSRPAFWEANVEGTRAMLRAAEAAGVGRFVQVSSLAAREPALSDYGASKAAADDAVRASPLRWTILRPPAVYGEGDRETLELIRAVARGFAPAIGQGRFSLIHVEDLARALLALALSPAGTGATLEVDDGREGGVSHAEFARLAGAALGRPPRVVPVPPAAVRLGAEISHLIAGLTGGQPRLSRDRARYFAHPDWVAHSAPLRALGIWAPRIGLEEGLARTVAWYRQAGWLGA